MPIRLEPKQGSRTKISTQFLENCKQLRARHVVSLAAKADKVEKKLARLSDHKRDAWNRKKLEKELEELNSAILLHSTRPGGRGGWDHELTRYRKLPYTKLMCKSRIDKNGIKELWLIGETAELTTYTQSGYGYSGRRRRANPRLARHAGTYDHGPYLICVNVMSLGTTNLKWHILRKDNPSNPNRHMHATVDRTADNPLDVRQRTCWGAFNGIVQAACEAADIPTLLQVLHQFAATLHLDSMLISVEALVSDKGVRKVSNEDLTKS